MKTIKTLSFRIEKLIADLVSEDAAKQHSNESTILRQIVYQKYENDPRYVATAQTAASEQ